MQFLDIFLQPPCDVCSISSQACIFTHRPTHRFGVHSHGVGGAHEAKVHCVDILISLTIQGFIWFDNTP
jgi:hypothetical protein